MVASAELLLGASLSAAPRVVAGGVLNPVTGETLSNHRIAHISLANKTLGYHAVMVEAFGTPVARRAFIHLATAHSLADHEFFHAVACPIGPWASAFRRIDAADANLLTSIRIAKPERIAVNDLADCSNDVDCARGAGGKTNDRDK